MKSIRTLISPGRRAWIGRVFYALSLMYLFSAAAVLLLDGYSIRYGPFRLSSRSVSHDLFFAAATGAIALACRRDAIDGQSRTLFAGIERAAPWIAGAVSVAVLGVGLGAGTHCACGSDAYGYVSEAQLWAKGTLHVPQPLTSVVPWPFADWTLSPLGYRPATHPGAIVPTYAPGLPLLMAAALTIGRTPSAVFVVVPALGAIAAWCTYLLGKRLDGPVTGMWGALLLALSPTFLFHVIAPLSDVPVTALWLIALVMLLRQTNASALLAGLACSGAVLTRPNLAPLVPVFLLVPVCCTSSITRATRYRRLLLFGLGALPGPLAVAWIQNTLYGSPTKSGYGDLRDLYALANLVPNLRLYPRWLWDTHGAFIFLGLMSPLVCVSQKRAISRSTGCLVLFAFVFTAVLYAGYIGYSVFDNWTYTRFLLPAIPLLLLLSVWTVSAVVRSFGSATVHLCVMIGLAFVAVSFMRDVGDRRILEARRGERRNIEAGRYIAATSSPDVLVLAMQHSGSVRYYAGRDTIRYDWLDPHGLDSAILAIQRMNRGPLLVLDDWEEPDFRRRFQGQRWGALDWPPRVEIETEPMARLYDPSDRDRHLAHQPVRTTRLLVK